MPSRTTLDFASIMGLSNNARAAGGRSRHAGVANGDDYVMSLLFLLATDVVAGVGLRSALRSFVKSHVPLIEFSTGIDVSDIQHLEQPERQLRTIRLQLQQRPSDDAQFVVRVKGLKNRGQTCYANSVLQAMASIKPLYEYLQYMQHTVIDRGDCKDSIALALLQTVQYVNGHALAWRKPARLSRLPFAKFLSSSYRPGDPQRVMDLVAKHYSQFRSQNSRGMAGTLEQQDSHEFFSALMDVLSLEDQDGENAPSATVAVQKGGRGLACSNSFLNIDGSVFQVSAGNSGASESGGGTYGNQFAKPPTDPSDLVTDEYEEEKKHEEQIAASFGSEQPARINNNGNHNDGNEVQKEVTPANNAPVPDGHPASTRPAALQNPFDGWSGSTIKCAACQHIRPIRSTPFLGLSLPIANVQSEFLEDFLAAEYGGFASAERVQGVQCFSCAIGQRVQELEEEDLLLSGAISRIQRRRKAQNGNGNGSGVDDIAGLIGESNELKRKIAILEALDPDADDDKLECKDDHDAQQEMDLGLDNSLPPITPLRCDAYKAMLLMRPPQVLCVHIQRRHYDMSCQRMVKIMRHVHFPEWLDLGSYCAYSGGRMYKLMSVIEHMGSAFGGHYQTYRRVDPEKDEWVVVSDENVSTRSWDDVRRCQAYMLFYVAVHKH